MDHALSKAYQDGVRIAQKLNPNQYERLIQLQELARQHGYQDDEWGGPSHDQILFILGVCDRFRDDYVKASGNWLDLDTINEQGE